MEFLQPSKVEALEHLAHPMSPQRVAVPSPGGCCESLAVCRASAVSPPSEPDEVSACRYLGVTQRVPGAPVPPGSFTRMCAECRTQLPVGLPCLESCCPCSAYLVVPTSLVSVLSSPERCMVSQPFLLRGLRWILWSLCRVPG